MKAIVVTDQAAGTAGMKLVERPEPQGAALASLSGANYGDVVVQVHASGFTWDELSWPSTWIDRLGRDRTPSIPGTFPARVRPGSQPNQRATSLSSWSRTSDHLHGDRARHQPRHRGGFEPERGNCLRKDGKIYPIPRLPRKTVDATAPGMSDRLIPLAGVCPKNRRHKHSRPPSGEVPGYGTALACT